MLYKHGKNKRYYNRQNLVLENIRSDKDDTGYKEEEVYWFYKGYKITF